jgi:deazaflavin-dependent oxidoreductase (nitroreductase family)
VPVNNHPNNAPGVPMVFPPTVHRLQVKYLNPVVKKVARFLPTFAMIEHRGRKSGRPYETVVNVHRKGNTIAVVLGHGKADWVKNVVAAGDADMHLFRRDVHIVNPRVVPAGTDDPGLPVLARRAARRIGVFVAETT